MTGLREGATHAVVEASGIFKSIGNSAILRDVSLQVGTGNVVGLLGKNGAGKTTLMEVLLGFSPPSAGSSHLFGSDSMALPGDVKGRIGFVPQRDELINGITGRAQLALIGSLHRRWNPSLIERLVQAWEVPVNTRIRDLSPGERQKLSTLLALGHEPDLLVLDEPASSLDPIARRHFLQEILAIAASAARTVLFSTHIVSDLERVANQVIILREGAIAWADDIDLLKESVVRLHVQARSTLPHHLGVDQVISSRIEGFRASLIVRQWDAALCEDLERRFDAEVSVEPLGLEDIFVELHS